jgi:hypothetical protein
MGLFFKSTEQGLGGPQGVPVARGPVVSDQSIKGKRVQISMFARIARLARIGDLGKVTSMNPIAKVFFQIQFNFKVR